MDIQALSKDELVALTLKLQFDNQQLASLLNKNVNNSIERPMSSKMVYDLLFVHRIAGEYASNIINSYTRYSREKNDFVVVGPANISLPKAITTNNELMFYLGYWFETHGDELLIMRKLCLDDYINYYVIFKSFFNKNARTQAIADKALECITKKLCTGNGFKIKKKQWYRTRFPKKIIYMHYMLQQEDLHEEYADRMRARILAYNL